MASTSRTTRSASMQSTPETSRNWLPLARNPPLLTKPFKRSYIKKHMHNDWFLTLASAMADVKKDNLQSRMFTKLYLFLLDYFPHGLVGKFGHVCGEDVVNHLLCNTNEQALSRHKATKDAENAFAALEEWMEGGTDWKVALSQHDTAAKDAGPKRKGADASKVPGLYSPAGMLALLVIAHPNQTHKHRIGSLGIEWMIEARDTLSVNEGFWKGITANDLPLVFKPAESRQPAVELLADYTALFGPDFPQCQEDIRPFLQPWAANIILGERLLLGNEKAVDGAVEVVPEVEPETDRETVTSKPDKSTTSKDQETNIFTADLTTFWEHIIQPDTTKTLEELGAWLLDKRRTASEIMAQWCGYWGDRIEGARTDEEQSIVRSLFVQSCYRLYSMDLVPTVCKPEAYMILDVEDGGEESGSQDLQDHRLQEAQRRLINIPVVQGCIKANAELSKLVVDSQPAVDFVERISTQQLSFFHKVWTDTAYNRHAQDVILLCRLRTEFTIQEIGKTRRERPVESAVDSNCLSPKQRETLLVGHAILSLTDWQQQQLLMPGVDIKRILTQRQCHFYFVKFQLAQGETYPIELPMPGIRPVQLPTMPEGELENERRFLHNLFAQLNPNNYKSQSFEADPTNLPEATALMHPNHPMGPPTATVTNSAPKNNMPLADSVGTGSGALLATPPLATPLKLFNRKRPIGSSPAQINPFAGRSGAKKARLDGSGLPCGKLGDVSKEEWSREFQAGLEANNAKLIEQLDSRDSIDDLKKSLLAELKTNQETLKREIRMEYEPLKACLAEATKQVGAVMQETRHLLQKIQASLNGTEASQEYILKEMQAIRSKMDELQKEEEMKQCEPELGEPGYLARSCMADVLPAQYEARLVGAAWYYIAACGARPDSPEDGVLPDEEAFGKTMARFPDLPYQHIVTAIEHVHIREYGHPFDKDGGYDFSEFDDA